MLLVPAMPIGDPAGGFSEIPRIEWWLLHVASLESIWGQWTNHGPASLLDRIPYILGAVIWLSINYALGRSILALDASNERLSVWLRSGLSIACGSVLSIQCVMASALTFGTRSRWGVAAWLLGIGIALHFGSKHIGWKRRAPIVGVEKMHAEETEAHDITLHASWSRRLFGLSILGCVWIALLTLAGACLPSYDLDLREHGMMAIKEYFQSGQLAWIERNAEANAPLASMMPSLFWMAMLQSDTPPRLIDAVLVGQVTQACQWLVAVGLLGLFFVRKYGRLAASMITFALLAHPGMFELVRLGHGAGGAALGMIAAGVLLDRPAGVQLPRWSLLVIASGAVVHSYWLGLVLGLPLLVVISLDLLRQRDMRFSDLTLTTKLRCISLFIFLVAVSSYWYVRNVLACGDPIQPWGRGGLGLPTPAASSTALQQAWILINRPWASMSYSDWIPSTLSACSRSLWDSIAHGLILVPLASVGLFAPEDKWAKTALGWWCAAWLVWWLLTPHMDRDWVLMTPLLSWPAAHGLAWLQRQRQRWPILAVGLLSLVWSVVVLAAWPTCDNRLLVPLRILASSVPEESNAEPSDREGLGAGQGRANEGTDAATAPRYLHWLNSNWESLAAGFEGNRGLLLVGSADAFRFMMPTHINGLYDLSLWDDLVDKIEANDLEPQTIRDKWAGQGISHIVFDWRSLRGRDRVLGIERETRYRNAIRQLVAQNLVRQEPWAFLSSDAECFVVIHR